MALILIVSPVRGIPAAAGGTLTGLKGTEAGQDDLAVGDEAFDDTVQRCGYDLQGLRFGDFRFGGYNFHQFCFVHDINFFSGPEPCFFPLYHYPRICATFGNIPPDESGQAVDDCPPPFYNEDNKESGCGQPRKRRKRNMKKLTVFAALLLALCLAGTAAPAEAADLSGAAGTWYTEEIMMTIGEDGRFVLGWNDGDWTGRLEPVERTNEDGEEYTAFRMVLDHPEDSIWDDLELVPDIYHPGKLIFFRDGTPGEIFYNVPVSITDMDGEDLSYYEPYTLIDTAEGEEPAATMMITLLRPAADIAVMAMSEQEFDEDGSLLYAGETLEWWEELDSQERIVITHVFEGDLPELALSFIGEDETGYAFGVQLSGADGEPELVPLLPPNG